MKTKNSNSRFYMIFTLILALGLAWNMNSAQAQCTNNCVNTIPKLTEQQKVKLQELCSTHQKDMELLKSDKQSPNEACKSKCATHKAEVRNILNDEQKKFFDENIANKGNCGNAGAGCPKAQGKGCCKRGAK